MFQQLFFDLSETECPIRAEKKVVRRRKISGPVVEQLSFTFDVFTDSDAIAEETSFTDMVLREMKRRFYKGNLYSKDESNMIRMKDGTEVLLLVEKGFYKGFALSKQVVEPTLITSKVFMYRGKYPACAETLEWDGGYVRYTECKNPEARPVGPETAQKAAYDVIGTLVRWA